MPFFRDNPRLRITQRVDNWQANFILKSDPERYMSHEAWCSIFRWMCEVKRLRAKGMSDESFSLVIHGPSADASQNFVDTAVKVAAWQDANAEHFRRQQATSDLSVNGVISGFPEIVKEVLQGTIPVCLESKFSDEIWDTAKILREHEGTWPVTFVEAVPDPPLIEPAERWEAARNENRIEFDHLDRLEGYNKLLEGW